MGVERMDDGMIGAHNKRVSLIMSGESVEAFSVLEHSPVRDRLGAMFVKEKLTFHHWNRTVLIVDVWETFGLSDEGSRGWQLRVLS